MHQKLIFNFCYFPFFPDITFLRSSSCFLSIQSLLVLKIYCQFLFLFNCCSFSRRLPDISLIILSKIVNQGMEDQFKVVRGVLQLMYEEQQKQTKLVSVINGLTSIKEQLQQLMPPKSDDRTNDTNQKALNMQFIQSAKEKISPQKPQHQFFQSPNHQKYINVSSKSFQKKVLAFQPKNRLIKQSPLKIEKQSNQKQPKSSYSNKTNPIAQNKFDPHSKPSQKLHFLPKNQREKNNNIFVDIVNRAANEQQWMTSNQKTFSHYRHSSQRDLHTPKSFNIQLTSTADIQKQYTKQRKIRSKPFFHFRNPNKPKNNQITQGARKLMRMKSDLIDHSQTFKMSIAENVELEGFSTARQDLADKIKELQQENYQKQGIIHILEAELAQIQTTFTQMKLSIAKLLHIGGNSCKNLEQIDLNEGLTQIIKDLQMNKQEMQRISADGQAWKKKSVEQALLIKHYEESLQNYGKTSLAFNELREQNCKFKDQLANITSKLEVSINENRIKDEFIVKFLVGRGNTVKENDEISNVLVTVEEYLRTCSYPSNRLLQKLNEQQAEIKRLKEIIYKDSSQLLS